MKFWLGVATGIGIMLVLVGLALWYISNTMLYI